MPVGGGGERQRVAFHRTAWGGEWAELLSFIELVMTSERFTKGSTSKRETKP